MTSDEKQTNAMELAAVFNSLYQKNIITFPTLQADSVTEATIDRIKPLGRKYLQEVLIGLNKGDGIQASYAPKKVELAGIYGNYQGKDIEMVSINWQKCLCRTVPSQEASLCLGGIHQQTE